jgi:hypothetical protein
MRPRITPAASRLATPPACTPGTILEASQNPRAAAMA